MAWTTAVIIGSSARSDPDAKILARCGAGDDCAKAGNLAGVLVDCGAVHGWFTGELGVHVAPEAFLASPNPKIATLSNVREQIQKALDSSFTTVIVYYSGHGQGGTGAWCFDEGTTMTPSQLIDLHQQSYRHKTLIIITDSCYSGKWVDAAKDKTGVHVQASSESNRVSYDSAEGGYFTRAFIKYAGKDCNRSPQVGDVFTIPAGWLQASGAAISNTLFSNMSSPTSNTLWNYIPVSDSRMLQFVSTWAVMHLEK